MTLQPHSKHLLHALWEAYQTQPDVNVKSSLSLFSWNASKRTTLRPDSARELERCSRPSRRQQPRLSGWRRTRNRFCSGSSQKQSKTHICAPWDLSKFKFCFSNFSWMHLSSKIFILSSLSNPMSSKPVLFFSCETQKGDIKYPEPKKKKKFSNI